MNTMSITESTNNMFKTITMLNKLLAVRARTCFENLKKNYSKKRSNLRNSKKSGTSRMAVEKAENELNQLSFLVWLDEFIRARNSRSSFDNANHQSDDGESFDGDSTLDHDHNDDDQLESQQIEDSFIMSPGVTNDPSEVTNDFTTSNPGTVFEGSKRNVTSKRKISAKDSEIDAQKLSFLKTINQRMEARDKKSKTEDVEDRYAATIADRLRDLPRRERLMAKHEIENTFFKFQMQALDKDGNNNIMMQGNVNCFPLPQIPTVLPNQVTPQYFQNLQQQQQQQQQQQAINMLNQPLSPSYSETPMASPSYPYNAPNRD